MEEAIPVILKLLGICILGVQVKFYYRATEGGIMVFTLKVNLSFKESKQPLGSPYPC